VVFSAPLWWFLLASEKARTYTENEQINLGSGWITMQHATLIRTTFFFNKS
jgi:hypothetical protein